MWVCCITSFLLFFVDKSSNSDWSTQHVVCVSQNSLQVTTIIPMKKFEWILVRRKKSCNGIVIVALATTIHFGANERRQSNHPNRRLPVPTSRLQCWGGGRPSTPFLSLGLYGEGTLVEWRFIAFIRSRQQNIDPAQSLIPFYAYPNYFRCGALVDS
jgi:hypothetical protein